MTVAGTCTPCQFGGCAHCRPPCACDHGDEQITAEQLAEANERAKADLDAAVVRADPLDWRD